MVNKTLGFIITPIQSGLSSVSNLFKSTKDYITGLNDLEEKNVLLKSQIEALEQENKKLRQGQADLKRYRALFKLEQDYDNLNMIGARIIAKSPGNWYDTFTVNKGAKDGLEKNMVVMASGGIVGHIRSVSNNFAVVQTIIDDISSVHAKDIRTGDKMFVDGDKKLAQKGLCTITFINKDAEVIVGDELVTSELGNIYPPDLYIGVVTRIEKNPNNLMKTAYLKTAVDFTDLTEVLIITDKWKADLQQEQSELDK